VTVIKSNYIVWYCCCLSIHEVTQLICGPVFVELFLLSTPAGVMLVQ